MGYYSSEALKSQQNEDIEDCEFEHFKLLSQSSLLKSVDIIKENKKMKSVKNKIHEKIMSKCARRVDIEAQFKTWNKFKAEHDQICGPIHIKIQEQVYRSAWTYYIYKNK